MWGSRGLTQMQDASRRGDNGAEVGVTAAAKPNHLAADAILLGGEFQSYKGGRKELGGRGGGQAERKITEEEPDITDLERLGVRGGAGVFAGTE